MVIRRYLKLTFQYCDENQLLDKKVEELNNKDLPFKIECIPTKFPKPSTLVLNIR